MIRVNAVVEGQTEESFIRESLSRHLAMFGIGMTPRRVEFGRKRGRIHRGGLIEYPRLRKDVANWLNQDTKALVTTMVDLYALPDGFPGRSEGAKIANPRQRVAYLEEMFGKDIGSGRFIPHIQLHEFEAILFSDVARLSSYYPAHATGIQKLVVQSSQFDSPELIDEGRLTAPSKRILREVPIYEKVVVGSVMAIELGLPLIRSRCPHFDGWVRNLEKLSAAEL
jgi:hypothetical protein